MSSPARPLFKVTNLNNQTLLAHKAGLADTFLSRLIGLLNRSSLVEGEALILKPASSIHTFFMRFSIDVLFLDKSGKVIAALSVLKPFRMSPIYFRAYTIIELPQNTIQSTHTQPGDTIQITPN